MQRQKKTGRRFLCLLCALWLCAGFYVQAADVQVVPIMAEPGADSDAGQETEEKERPELSFYEKGDVVGFIGDSITHVEYSSINYVEFLYNFYLSRYPEQEVEFRNLGVSSYKASDILDIYDQDPAFEGITKAVIMLGMNEALQKVSTETYISNMEKLVDRLKKDGLKGEDILVLSPTPYDQTCAANFDANGNPYRKADDALTDYTEQLEKKTREWGVCYVDLHTPMLELTQEIQKEDKNRTLTIWDCVHPDALGQMTMAYYILKAQGAQPVASELCILPEGETRTQQAEISELYSGEKGLCWTVKYQTLPMAMTYEFQEFDQLFDLVGELNQMPLKITGLKEETSYTITMGGEVLGSFTGKELAEGINLGILETNPLEAAMLEAEELNQQWHTASAEYRKIVRFATMAEPTHTREQMLEAYDTWKNTELMLRDGMYEKVQSAVARTYRITVTEEGYSAEELEAEAAAAAERALEEEQAAAVEQESGKAQGMSTALKLLLTVSGVIAVILLAVLAVVVWYTFRAKNRSDRKREKNGQDPQNRK